MSESLEISLEQIKSYLEQNDDLKKSLQAAWKPDHDQIKRALESDHVLKESLARHFGSPLQRDTGIYRATVWFVGLVAMLALLAAIGSHFAQIFKARPLP